jgi:hypothetical protein
MQKGVPTATRDHTSLVVQAGLLLLLVLGLGTVFGEALSGALFPPAEAPAAHAPERPVNPPPSPAQRR